VSLPVILPNNAVSLLFPDAEVVYGFEPGSGYRRQTELEPGRGYWVKMKVARTYTLTGPPILENTLSIDKNGWDLIGGCGYSAQAVTVNGAIVAIYRFVPGTGYQRLTEEDNLQPGQGYWILYRNVAEGAELKVALAESGIMLMRFRADMSLPLVPGSSGDTEGSTDSDTSAQDAMNTGENTNDLSVTDQTAVSGITSDDQEIVLTTEDNVGTTSSDTLGETEEVLSDIINNGILSPGNSPGILNVRRFTQGRRGILLIEIGGTTPGRSYDQLNVSETATLDGSLEISLWNGFMPGIGDSFQILTYDAVIGGFEDYRGLEISDSLRIVPIQDEAGLILITSQVPDDQAAPYSEEIPSDAQDTLTYYAPQFSGVPVRFITWTGRIVQGHINVRQKNIQAGERVLALVAKALRMMVAQGLTDRVISISGNNGIAFILTLDGMVRASLSGQINGGLIIRERFIRSMIDTRSTGVNERVYTVMQGHPCVDLPQTPHTKRKNRAAKPGVANPAIQNHEGFAELISGGNKELGVILASGPLLGAAALGMQNRLCRKWPEEDDGYTE
jgi:hypothetical protein